MGGGGFTWDAAKKLKANNEARKRNSSFKDSESPFEEGFKKIEIPEITEEERKLLQNKIQKDKRKYRLKQILLALIIIPLSFFLIYIIYVYVFEPWILSFIK